jgi:prepilin-type N-terminal cleavage/methylation domain-containing protein
MNMRMRNKIKKYQLESQKGFTIIELLVATTIFSIVLVVIVASFLQVGRMFYKGVSVNNTNEASRGLVDDISSDIRLSDANTILSLHTDPADTTKKYFCTGQHRYTYIIANQVKQDSIINPDTTPVLAKNMHAGIIQDITGGACPAPSATDGTSPRQMLGPNMQLNLLSVAQTGTLVNIHAHVIFYGVDDTVFAPSLTDPAARCSGSLLSTQFCAIADINTNVTLGY